VLTGDPATRLPTCVEQNPRTSHRDIYPNVRVYLKTASALMPGLVRPGLRSCHILGLSPTAHGALL
jgi:hypothetical protein